jgi:hypothetical protein
VQYSIDFIEDDFLTQSESYQFIIQNINNSSSPRDPFVRETIMRIVEEFFRKINPRFCISVILQMVSKA